MSMDDETYPESTDIDGSEYSQNLLCMKNICQSVSEDHQVSDLWKRYETYMDMSLENMKSCPELESAELIQK